MSPKSLILAASILLLSAYAAQAATYLVPEDRELIQRSEHVVVAVGVSSLAERNARGAIVTRYTLRVEEALKGDLRPGDLLTLTESGGRAGDVFYYVPGAPHYELGQRYVVFTDRNRDFEPVTFGMSLGQFRVVREGLRTLALRSDIAGLDARNLGEFSERARDARGFLEYVRGIVAQTIDPEPRYFVAGVPSQPRADSGLGVISPHFTRTSYLMQTDGRGYRWPDPTVSFVTTGASPNGVDGLAGVDQAMAQWNGTASSIDWSRGPHDDTLTAPILCEACDDGRNSIYLTDVADEVGTSVAGIAGVKGEAEYSFGGETFFRVTEADLVINDIVTQQGCYNTVMTHEMGHTLGFRHSNEPPPGGEASNDAIMRSSVVCGWDGILKTYDRAAAATVYGSGPVCEPPAIATQPPSRTIMQGTTTSLTVVARGSNPAYQWYIGASGDISAPIAGAIGPTIGNLSPATTTSYWVRVSGECGTPADSDTATITVTPFVCPAVTISGVTATPQISGTFRLSVVASSSGQALSYEWYEGATPGEGGTLIGTSAAASASGSVPGSYWVRVRNACGNSSVSDVVTVTPCKAAVTAQPDDQTIQAGATADLRVDFSGTNVTVRWYRGSAGDKQNLAGIGPRIKTEALTQTTAYWANLSNPCGETATRTMTVTVEGGCVPPVIATQPTAVHRIATGTSATLTLVAGAGEVHYQWYEGALGDVSRPVGRDAPTFITPALTKTTAYWARLRNGCGEVNSIQILVEVVKGRRRAVGRM